MHCPKFCLRWQSPGATMKWLNFETMRRISSYPKSMRQLFSLGLRRDEKNSGYYISCDCHKRIQVWVSPAKWKKPKSCRWGLIFSSRKRKDWDHNQPPNTHPWICCLSDFLVSPHSTSTIFNISIRRPRLEILMSNLLSNLPEISNPECPGK